MAPSKSQGRTERNYKSNAAGRRQAVRNAKESVHSPPHSDRGRLGGRKSSTPLRSVKGGSMVADKLPVRKHAPKDQVTQCVMVLADVCRFFGFAERTSPSEDLKGTIEHWKALSKELSGDWMKVAKYKIAAYFAVHTKQTLPEKPFQQYDRPDKILGGAHGRFCSLMLREPEMRRMSFLTSILQSKKGMPRAPPALLKQKEQELIQKLTAEPKPARGLMLRRWADADEYVHPVVDFAVNRLTAEKQLKRTVMELFRDKRFTLKDRVKAFFPSTSANYISSRSNAGAVGEILRHPRLLEGLRKAGGHLHITHSEEERKESHDELVKEPIVDYTEFQRAFQTFWFRVLKLAEAEEMEVTPVALAEPLKIRVITKGPPFVQTVLRALWKFMHTTLRNHKTFKLIGQPVDEFYLKDVLGNNLPEGQGYLSADYEAATDNLQSWASECVAETIADAIDLSTIERRLLKAALTQHRFAGRPQTQGQLMGSIVSFPILCIVNATVARWSLEVTHKRMFLLHDAPMMVNGDDLALRSTPECRTNWAKISQFVGLKESVGKTYFSREFVNINSTNYLRDEVNPTIQYVRHPTRIAKVAAPFRLTPYVNLGLVYGLKRSGGKTSLNDLGLVDNIGVRYRKMIRLAPREMQEQVTSAFLNHHRPLLTSLQVPWYLPEWIGGLGLTGVREPSELDLRLARMILLNWKTRHPIQIKVGDQPWTVWLRAEKDVPVPVTVQKKENSGIQMYNDLVSQKCIDLLFDSRVTLGDLYQNAEPGAEGRADAKKLLAHNSKVWAFYLRDRLPAPMNKSELEFRSAYKSYRPDPAPVSAPSSGPLD